MSFNVFTFQFVLMVSATAARARPGAGPGPGAGAGLLPDMPASCGRAAYCTHRHRDYPSTLVNELMNNFTLSLGDVDMRWHYRQGNKQFKSLCNEDLNLKTVYEVRDEAGAVRVVVQTDRFAQAVKLQTCKFAETSIPSSTLSEVNLAALRRVSCQTKLVTFELVVLAADGRGLEALAHALPVACACHYARY